MMSQNLLPKHFKNLSSFRNNLVPRSSVILNTLKNRYINIDKLYLVQPKQLKNQVEKAKQHCLLLTYTLLPNCLPYWVQFKYQNIHYDVSPSHLINDWQNNKLKIWIFIWSFQLPIKQKWLIGNHCAKKRTSYKLNDYKE